METSAQVPVRAVRRASPEPQDARIAALEARIEELEQQGVARDARLDALETLVGGRNKSAPTKRNMTDHDARRVLDGDLRELDHKAAAEVGGLTYAQVYSCRKEFTFKHVHKDLRGEKWKNPWTK